MSKSLRIGMWILLAYVLVTSSTRVYMGALFQELDAVVSLVFTFTVAAIAFHIPHLLSLKKLYGKVGRNLKDVFLLNIVTTMLWFGFFLALKFIEPSVTAVIGFSLPPILNALFWKWLRPNHPVKKGELVASIGIAAATVFVAGSTLLGLSAVGEISQKDALSGLTFCLLSAFGIAWFLNISKRFNEKGFAPSEILAIRFFLLIAVGIFFYPRGYEIPLSTGPFIFQILLVAGIGVMLPAYLIQKGSQRVEPITAALIVALSPLVTKVLQVFDSRLIPSEHTIIGLIACLVFSIYGIRARFQKPFPKIDVRLSPPRVPAIKPELN